jgi:hypothetical protein
MHQSVVNCSSFWMASIINNIYTYICIYIYIYIYISLSFLIFFNDTTALDNKEKIALKWKNYVLYVCMGKNAF